MPIINDLFPSIFSIAGPQDQSAKEVVLRLGRFYNGTPMGEARLQREADIWSGLAEGRVMLPHDRDNLGWWGEPPIEVDSRWCSMSHKLMQGLFTDIGNSDVQDTREHPDMPQLVLAPLKATKGFEIRSTNFILHFWVPTWCEFWMMMVTDSAVIHSPTKWICDWEEMDRAWDTLENICFKDIRCGEGGEQ
ncbi:MAG: hypothetical protein IPL06_19780 [Betaproteobacteria bacterium]|nr:hypothetical protein [Betaproteobacteria bacterium]